MYPALVLKARGAIEFLVERIGGACDLIVSPLPMEYQILLATVAPSAALLYLQSDTQLTLPLEPDSFHLGLAYRSLFTGRRARGATTPLLSLVTESDSS